MATRRFPPPLSVMTHASSARQLTARTKTANVMGSDTIAVAVDRRDEGADVYLVDRVKGQWDFTETRR